MKRLNLWHTALCCGAFLVLGCAKERQPIGGPWYFADTRAYCDPVCLTERLGPESIKDKTVYFEAYFNSNGLPLKVTKYLRGAVAYEMKYTYRDNGKVATRIMRGDDGNVTVRTYEADGKHHSDKTAKAPQ